MSDWGVPDEFKVPDNHDWMEHKGGEINPFFFEPPGPVGEAYAYGMEPIDYIMGPVGSGKTTCSTFRIGAFSMRVPPCKDETIRVRGAVLHQNFRALYRTGLDSIFQFFPKDFPGSTFEGGQDRPFRFTLRFVTPKGRKLQIILDGFGIGQHSIEQLLRGYQCNFAWMVEADLIPRKAPAFMYSRVAQGRYPGRAFLQNPEAEVPGSVWGDLNPPLISHYIHEDFVEKPREGYLLRRQPSGLSDEAENRKYSRRQDYEAMAKTLPPDEVRRFVHGEFGLQGDGALVYPEFDHQVHVAPKQLEPLDAPLMVGADGGGSPALMVGQLTPKGHMRWLAELCTPQGQITGVGRFCEMVVDLLAARFHGLPVRRGFGDPSAFHGHDKQAGELSFMDTVGRAIGVQMLPTETNEPGFRQEAVARFLRRGRDADGVPFFQMCPTMKVTQKGFQGGFMIEMNKHETSDRIRFVKNAVSHIHEAGQYLAYGSVGHAGTMGLAAKAGRPGNVIPILQGQPKTDFDVFNV